MRTTVEIPDELRVRPIEESARTGERGYSAIVARALTEYFARSHRDTGITDAVNELYGSEPDADAGVGGTRGSWRTGRGA